jgi:hypothetical protein
LEEFLSGFWLAQYRKGEAVNRAVIAIHETPWRFGIGLTGSEPRNRLRSFSSSSEPWVTNTSANSRCPVRVPGVLRS